MSDVIIRSAGLSDAEAINRLNTVSMGYDYPLEKAKLAIEKVLSLPEHILLVAEVGGKAAGYVHADDYSTVYADNLMNILGIAVDPAFQSMGIGKKLLEAVENRARERNASGIRLTSGEKRKGAHEFYEKLGYESDGMKKAFSKLF